MCEMQDRAIKAILPDSLGRTKRAAVSKTEATWRKIRAICAAFTILVSLVMLFSHLGREALEPLKSPELVAVKEKLRQNPADEQTKQEIRRLDLELRGRYFKRLSQSNSGVWLMLGGAAGFIIAASRCAGYRARSPILKSNTPAESAARTAGIARWSVSVAGATVATCLLLLSLRGSTGLNEGASAGQTPGSPQTANVASSDAASEDELNNNWPRFRGPHGSGVSQATNVPASWDAKTGAGVALKTPVPAPGFNSPIVWGDHFYFSGGDPTKREVFCYDCLTGKMLWRQAVVPTNPGKPSEIPDTTGYAASSMATDGRRVYVIFATGDVAAFTLDGKQVWAKSFGPLKNPYGHATSLLTWRDRLILLLDQGESEDGKSKLYALDGRTGQVVWQTARKVGSSWATPITFEAAGQNQVVALAIPWAISYRLTDGSELWRVECLSGEITPSPIFADRLVFVPSPSEKLLAIRPDGQGDVTKTNVVWSTEENVPDVSSPVSSGGLVFTLTTPGLLSCFETKGGKKLWEHDFEMEFHSSPSIAANRLYLFGQKGTAIVAEAGQQFKELSRTEMPDVFHASPAFTQNMIILRGSTNLWGLASAPK